jgi:aldehyde dehydrogenase (NAD+)
MYDGKNYLNGQWLTRDNSNFELQYFKAANPSTEEVYGEFPCSRSNVVKEAVKHARFAQKDWRKQSRLQRADYFNKLYDLIKKGSESIANTISVETGKILNESRAEVTEAMHMLQYAIGRARMPNGECIASELPERDIYVITKPKGVVAVITPWNFPFAIHFWNAAPAIVEGNTVVFKPSEETPMTGQVIAELYDEAGFPGGVLNLVHGDGTTGAALVYADVDHICFTGSAEVGQFIRNSCSSSKSKTCSCEMGSKSAVIVFEDGDYDLALKATIASAFKLSGQRCVSSGRMLIQRSIYGRFCRDFVELAADIKVGDPFSEPNSLYGPLISKTQMERVLKFNKLVLDDKEAKVDLNGVKINRKGWYLTPHVYRTEWSEKPYLHQEVFGPHVALVPFDETQDAIDMYNDTDFGLSCAVITTDFKKMRECRDKCDYGMIYFNLASIGAESHVEFKGVKASGNGWGSAAGTFEAVTHRVAVTINHGGLSFPQGLK